MKNLNLIPVHLLLAVVCLPAKAQKLPGVQTVNVWAPVDVKTDGKAKEWGDEFEAFNKTTSIFYTIANDNEKLYLTIQARETGAIDKIVNGGVTFTIKNPDKTAAPLSVTYPLISVKNGRSFVLQKIRYRSTLVDSDLNTINKQLGIGCKEIKVTGIKELPDSMISVYNSDGIKVAGLFDHQRAYTYEMAISLKYLIPLINDMGTFSYKVTLNGINSTTKMKVSGAGTGAAHAYGTKVLDPLDPTYFSGKYTLARQ